MKIIKLMRGTNTAEGNMSLSKKFNDITWWSDDYETVAHYYEGCVIEIELKIYPEKEQEFIHELDDLTVSTKDYSYGFAEMICPKGAIWYSISSQYLKENLISIKEIFPDLSNYN